MVGAARTVPPRHRAFRPGSLRLAIARRQWISCRPPRTGIDAPLGAATSKGRGQSMAQTSVPTITPFFGNFRVGRVFSTTGAVFSRNYLIFLLVMAIATVPDLALFGAAPAMPEMRAWAIATILVAWLLGWILTTVGQAVIAYGAFQDMRGAPAPLGEAVKKGLP